MPDADRILPFDASISIDALEDVFAELGLRLQNVVTPSDQHQAQRIYVTRDKNTLVYVVEDPRVDARFLLLRGAAAQAIEASITARFRVATRAVTG